MPSPTEQEHYAALLETAQPQMREALTQPNQAPSRNEDGRDCFCGHPPSSHGMVDGYVSEVNKGVCRKGMCTCKHYDPAERVPFSSIDSAHVALESWWLSEPGRFVRYMRTEQGLMVIVGSHNERGYGTGADIFEAVAAALKEA